MALFVNVVGRLIGADMQMPLLVAILDNAAPACVVEVSVVASSDSDLRSVVGGMTAQATSAQACAHDVMLQ